MRASPIDVISCFSEAWQLIFSKGFRRFIFIPLLLNLIIFIVLSALALDYVQALLVSFETHLPHWLQWIKWLLLPLIILCMLIAYGYSFNLVTTIIAAPFLGLLAEKVEARITGAAPPNESLMQLIPRTFKREFTKLVYFLPRSVGVLFIVLILMFLPGANIVGIILGGLWSSWCLALQFCDYAADNNQIAFIQVRTQLNQQKLTSFVFGGMVLLGSIVPVINVVITPLAVAAGTIYWVRKSA